MPEYFNFCSLSVDLHAYSEIFATEPKIEWRETLPLLLERYFTII